MTTKQRKQQITAAKKREDKAAAHAALMARHTARKAAIAMWITAYEGWITAKRVGPRPIHPDDVGTGSDMAGFRYDMEQGHYHDQQDDTADLVNVAAELGIDIA